MTSKRKNSTIATYMLHEARERIPEGIPFPDERNGSLRSHRIPNVSPYLLYPGDYYELPTGLSHVHGFTDLNLDLNRKEDPEHLHFKLGAWNELSDIAPAFIFETGIDRSERVKRSIFFKNLIPSSLTEAYFRFISGYLPSFLKDDINYNYNINDVISYLRHPAFVTLAATLVEKTDSQSRFLLGLITSQMSSVEMPDDIVAALKVNVKNNMLLNIKPFFRNYAICPASEGYLKTSMANNNAIIVNDFLVVKGLVKSQKKQEGYAIGLCIQNTTTPGGTFIEGAWYSPLPETEQALIDLYSNDGQKSIVLPQSEWVFIRDSSLYYNTSQQDKLLRRTKDYRAKV